MHVLIIANGTRVSTFLCTQKLGPEEISAVAYPGVGMGELGLTNLKLLLKLLANQNVHVKVK